MQRLTEFFACLLVLIVCSDAAVSEQCSEEGTCQSDLASAPSEEKMTAALLQVAAGVSKPAQPHIKGGQAPQHAAHLPAQPHIQGAKALQHAAHTKKKPEQEQQVLPAGQGAASSHKSNAPPAVASSHKSKAPPASSNEEAPKKKREKKKQAAPKKKAPQAAPKKSQPQGHVASSGSNKASSKLPKGHTQEKKDHINKASPELPKGKSQEKKHHSSKSDARPNKTGQHDKPQRAKRATQHAVKKQQDVHADRANNSVRPGNKHHHHALNQKGNNTELVMHSIKVRTVSDSEQKREDGIKMHNFVLDVLARIGGVVTHPVGFDEFLKTQHVDVVHQPLNPLLNQLRVEARRDDGWMQLPPPDKGPVLWKMIRSDPWDCALVPYGDSRSHSCGLSADSEELNPDNLHCGKAGSICSIEHANSYRTLQSVGSLPCCTTPPFCSAPACNLQHEPVKTCEKKSPQENVAYMKQADTWPSYHGWGGSYELDTLKLLDSLGCKNASDCPDKTFDLAIDLGANTGYYTEKLSLRNFAKNYIMIEANPKYANTLRDRWGTDAWKEKWFTQQVKQTEGAYPDFEIINHALSNHSVGLLDLCETERSMAESGCKVPIASVDSIIPNGLTPAFVGHVKTAKSAYIKIDTEGMDELVLRGMKGLLAETRGEYEDKTPRFLVNFMQFEFSPALMKIAKDREAFANYDIESVTKFLQSIGFETFMIGPRYLPLSHGSWNDEFKTWTADPSNNAGARLNYPKFDDRVCPWCNSMSEPSFTSDVFAIRSTHPRAAELKVALGACKESKEFDMRDPQYSF